MVMTSARTDRLGQQAQAVISRGSRSFAAATRLFQPALRRDVMLLYTWCRHCDDLIDGQELGQGRISTASHASLQQLRSDSLAALAGHPADQLPYQALADLARRHPIRQTLIEAHLRGFELDVVGWQPETLEDTLRYCYHTAGTVGMMMAMLMHVHDETTLYRASDLGIAFQLTNIARDVVEDAIAGRSYLPQDWRQAAGLAISDLADQTRQREVFPLIQRLVESAEPYYRSAALGIRALPRRAAWAIATARAVYRDIGHQIIQRGPEALSDRMVTGDGRKLWHMAAALPQVIALRHARPNPLRGGLWTPPEIA